MNKFQVVDIACVTCHNTHIKFDRNISDLSGGTLKKTDTKLRHTFRPTKEVEDNIKFLRKKLGGPLGDANISQVIFYSLSVAVDKLKHSNKDN